MEFQSRLAGSLTSKHPRQQSSAGARVRTIRSTKTKRIDLSPSPQTGVHSWGLFWERFRFLTGLRERLFEVAKKYPRGFLRGFLDSGGSAVVWEGHVRVETSNYDIEVLKLCQELLANLDIHPIIYRTKRKGRLVMIRGRQYRYNSDLFTLTITRKESVYRYTCEIRFNIL